MALVSKHKDTHTSSNPPFLNISHQTFTRLSSCFSAVKACAFMQPVRHEFKLFMQKRIVHTCSREEARVLR